MSRRPVSRMALLSALCLSGITPAAWAQWAPFRGGCGCNLPQVSPMVYPAAYQPISQFGGCSTGACSIGCAPPPVAQVSCAPAQFVPQFVEVPVTETRQVKQIVQRPVYETKYVEQPYTTYQQQVEVRTASVPTVQYQTVQEMQTRCRDAGSWVTNYRCRSRVSPCEYDNRPGLFGALNRSFYQTRMALTPAVVAERSYVPNLIAESVPVSRQVAVRGVQQMNYQVTKMVPVTGTRQVAVNTVRMVAEEVITNQNVTVMKSMPYETAVAKGLVPSMTRTALSPTPDYISVPSRTATNLPNSPVTPARPNIDAEETIRRSAAPSGKTGAQYTPSSSDAEVVQASNSAVEHVASYRPAPMFAPTVPSIVRIAQWSGVRQPAVETGSAAMEITVAKNGK